MRLNSHKGRSVAIAVFVVGVVIAAAGVGTFAGGVVGQESGPTQAPDLQSVDNFRSGTAGGEPATLADFTFDQNATLVGSGGNFRLVPADGGTDLGGQNVVAGDGTETITVAFSDSVTKSAIARGVVKKNTVRVTGEGDETNNPTQAAPVSNDGNSADPDLVNVSTNESGDALIYAFDEPVSVNSDSGFRAYYANASVTGGNVATDSLADPTLVKVTFDGFDASQAVGASVTEGTVSNTSDSDRTNSLDGVQAIGDSAPAFSKCGGGGTNDAGDGGDASGPTRAPDLVDIDNVTYRQNPEGTDCQTLVEFDFDEPVNTQGGAGNFQLVPIDGGPTLDGNNEIVGSKKNTTSLTVPFDGRIDPATLARGFVDAKTVQTFGEGDSTLNPKQAADLNNGGNTANPDLVSISVSGENELLFTFDEDISEIGDTSGFNFYDDTGTETDAQNVELDVNSSVVSVRFEPQANASTNAVGGSVDANAVVGTDTTREDGDKNQPDEAALGSDGTTTPTATATPTDTGTTATTPTTSGTDTTVGTTTMQTTSGTTTATETTTETPSTTARTTTESTSTTRTTTATPTTTRTETPTSTGTTAETTSQTPTAGTATETPTTTTSAETTTGSTDSETAATTRASDESGDDGTGGGQAFDESSAADRLSEIDLADGQATNVATALGASGLSNDQRTAITDALAGDGLSDEDVGTVADAVARGDLTDGQFAALADALADGTLSEDERAALDFLGEAATENETAYYQVDFVSGEPIHELQGPNGTYSNGELIRFAHGSSEQPITRRSAGEFTTNDTLADRIDSRNITVANGTATTTFTVSEGAPVTLSLVSYTKPEAKWSRETEHLQEFVDSRTVTVESGTHTLTVDLPNETTVNDSSTD